MGWKSEYYSFIFLPLPNYVKLLKTPHSKFVTGKQLEGQQLIYKFWKDLSSLKSTSYKNVQNTEIVVNLMCFTSLSVTLPPFSSTDHKPYTQ